MAQTIRNQASLNYQYKGQPGEAISNIATAVITDPLTAAKNSIENTYRNGDELTFVVSFINGSTAELTNVTVRDDLGTYQLGTVKVTPLTSDKPALYYVNGEYRGILTPQVLTDSVTFSIPSLAAGATALIVFKAFVNMTAPLAVGSEITNGATVDADGINNPITVSKTVAVEEYADVTVTKRMSPESIVDGTTLLYGFRICNYGNTAATNLVLTDEFDPTPDGITVAVNGVAVPTGNYTYAGGTLTLPTGEGYSLSIPPATITQDPATGIVTVEPSTLDVTVTGKL